VPEFLKEENYFFKLSKYTQPIKEKITSGEFEIYPQSRRNEILSLLERVLQDVSFSRPRKADWPQGLGVPVPGDAGQVMYVWCDALANYITALGYADEGDMYKKFWPQIYMCWQRHFALPCGNLARDAAFGRHTFTKKIACTWLYYLGRKEDE